MNNDFDNTNDDDLENLEILEGYLRSTNSHYSDLKEKRKRLDNQLRVRNFIDRLRDIARQADELINSLDFKKIFCPLYRKWLTKNVGSSIDLLNLVSIVVTRLFELNLPILPASFTIIGIMRRLSDNYCDNTSQDTQSKENER